METAGPKQLVEAYIEAYNRFDVAGMLAPLHNDVVFRNISNGEVNLTTTGKESFHQQAEQATQYFSQREQRVTDWQVNGQRVEAAIDYTAVAAIEFPNGLKPGDALHMQGRSVFDIENGQIISIEDISYPTAPASALTSLTDFQTLLLLGSGAREHALAEKLTRDGATVLVLPGNAGIPNSHSEIDPLDFEAVKAFAQAHGAKLIVVGPEAPLAAGITDFFAGSDIQVFGPTRSAARLESSKVWSKEFMHRYGVVTAQAWPFQSDNIVAARAKSAELGGHVVVKYDGLAAGKGVYVCSSLEEAESALDDLQASYTGWFSFLLEEKLTGPEISIIGLTDGHEIKLLATSQDHKQLLANDLGPNTGGMGAYCPVPFADDKVLAAIRRDIIDPTLRGLQHEQFEFRGFLYFGIMLTPTGPKLLEYNVRLGDPEAEVLLPGLDSSLLTLIEATLNGTLAHEGVRQRPGAFVGVVLASGGYPAPKFPIGFPITGLDNLPAGVRAYHGATKRDEAGQLVTNGGRVLVLTAHGSDLEEATVRAYEACARVTFEGAYFRTDIAQRPAPVLTASVVN